MPTELAFTKSPCRHGQLHDEVLAAFPALRPHLQSYVFPDGRLKFVVPDGVVVDAAGIAAIVAAHVPQPRVDPTAAPRQALRVWAEDEAERPEAPVTRAVMLDLLRVLRLR